MIKKLAVFVEGMTEQAFIEKLIEEIAGKRNLAIMTQRSRGGANCPRSVTTIRIDPPHQDTRYFALILDCCGDSRVKSEIRDQYESLTKAGYASIIGVRDVYPHLPSDIPKLRRELAYGIKTVPTRVNLILAIMEVEAWFLAEFGHFSRIHPSLTLERVRAHVGFDPSVDDMEARLNPAVDLDNIYQLAGLRYEKKANSIQRTISVLDYAVIYIEVSSRVPSLNELAKSVDAFLS